MLVSLVAFLYNICCICGCLFMFITAFYAGPSEFLLLSKHSCCLATDWLSDMTNLRLCYVYLQRWTC